MSQDHTVVLLIQFQLPKMRLLHTKTLQLKQFTSHLLVEYVILSHVWSSEEVSFHDLQNGEATNTAGFTKIKNCCVQAAKDGFQYVWIDTCCTYIFPPQDSCRRFWRHRPPNTAVFLSRHPSAPRESLWSPPKYRQLYAVILKGPILGPSSFRI